MASLLCIFITTFTSLFMTKQIAIRIQQQNDIEFNPHLQEY